MFEGWKIVAKSLCDLANDKALELNDGQRDSLKAVAERLPENGIIIADEVGMGKTRIATTVTKAVIDAGGRVAILVPPGLGVQWGNELRKSKVEGVPPILRSLWQYLKAWEDQANSVPWFEQKAMLISHAFCNWRLGANAEAWRWALLPELYARWRKLQDGRFPREYCGHEFLSDIRVKQAAESIANAVNTTAKNHPSRQRMNEFADQTPWPGALDRDRNAYARNADLRPALEKSVGLGLGLFDLVIIDEAHKRRGQESGLNRLLEHVVLSSDRARRLAITATPIELDADQWPQILQRIGVEDESANTAIANYAVAVQQVRQLPNDKKARNAFFDAAKGEKGFEKTMRKYLLRRDKREVQSVKDFANRSGNPHSDYRSLSDIAVSTANLSLAWKQAVCATEALSFVTRGLDDQTTKRLRLTLGNGHGIAALLDEPLRDEKEDPDDHEAQAAAEGSKPDKRLQRVDWWKQVISRTLRGDSSGQPDKGETALYEHPAILAAVEAIEAVCTQGEKVLVFGRFTRPMQALVHLLNARELLRCFEAKTHWPQERVHLGEQAAVESVLRKRGKCELLTQLNEWLGQQYRELENQRERFRTRLRNSLSQNLNGLDEKMRERALIALARPIQEMLTADEPTDDDIVRAFKDVVVAASDQDKETIANDDEAEGNAANQFSEEILQRMEEEYGRNEGGFARLMNGSTKPSTRRLLQLAFNREHSHPKVLVAQSVVGREGLNLHEACRTVILLHAEWNPGVVEQQVGRVDRINSLWEKMLKAASPATSADTLPRIEIRPVIFQGTYDEYNWKVLMQRWDDLRAQLHGVVITPSVGEKLSPELVKTINDCAPNFSPSKLNPSCTPYRSETSPNPAASPVVA